MICGVFLREISAPPWRLRPRSCTGRVWKLHLSSYQRAVISCQLAATAADFGWVQPAACAPRWPSPARRPPGHWSRVKSYRPGTGNMARDPSGPLSLPWLMAMPDMPLSWM